MSTTLSDVPSTTDRAPQGMRSREGIALATTLIVLVLVGSLVAAALFITNQDARAATNGRRMQQSFGIAEGGQADVFRTWTQTINARGIYPSDTLQLALTQAPHGTGAFTGSIYKLNSKQYLVDITGRDSSSIRGGLSGGGARQRVATLSRVLPLQVDIKAALTIGGKVTFGGGNVYIDGRDHAPPAWTSCTLDTAVAGVRAKSPGDVVASSGQVTGVPNVLITPTMDSTTFINYGSASYSSLAAQATINLPSGTYMPAPSLTSGKCNFANTSNWGDGATPTNPCGTYYPIVHITGDGTLTNGQGQGILLVDGNLVAAGTFTFYGIVIVRGGFSTVAGANPKIYGTVLAQSINLATTAFAGDAVVDYSQCAIQRSMDATGVATPLRSRSWVRVM